jgi:uncharacterized repeat protein (TIGR01451 family)
MMVLAMAIGAPGASAAPWSCSSFGYLFQSPNVLEGREVGPHSVEAVDLATGEFQTILETEKLVNAVGYDQVDNYMYGLSQTEPVPGEIDYHLVRINSDGSLEELPWPAGLPLDFASVVGDVDPEGHYWILGSAASNGGTPEWAEIDLNSEPPTLIASGERTPVPGLAGGADWAWINGALYIMGADPTTHEAHLIRFDPITHTETDVTPGGLGFSVTNPETGTADLSGAVYADASGYLYASYNASGEIWRIDPVTHEALKIANGPKSGSNDGARCASAPIPTVTVTKTVEGRVRPADQFTVGLLNPKGEAVASATTAGITTTATTTNFPASQGKTYTITDAMAAGSPSRSGEYVQSIKCTDSAGLAAPTGGTAGKWTLNIAEASAYTCNVTNKAQADVSLTKQATPSPQVPGSDETYSLTIKNSGPSAAINAKVTDPLPQGLAFLSAGEGCTFASGTVTCLAGDLAAGASKTFTITAAVASSATSCEASAVANRATGSSDTPDANQANNSASVCPPVAPQSDLEITKVASAPKVPASGQVMYTIVVHNKGPSDARRVKVDDSLPAELTLVSARPSQGRCSGTSCDLGAIVAGGSAQVLMTANVAPGAAGKQITNCASVSGKQAKSSGSGRACAVTEVPPNPPTPQPVSDLKVTKKASKKTVLLGRPLTYTLKVTNKGPDDAPEAKVTDTASKRLKTISVKPSQGTCDVGATLTCELGTLATGKTARIKVTAKVLRAGSVKNTVSTTTGGKDPEPKNNLDGVRTRVVAKLLLKKTSSARSVHAGDRVTYHLTATNPMGVAARHVRVCDSFPAGLAYVSSNPSAGAGKGQVCWRFKSLGAGRSKKITVIARALPGAAGNLTNHATATAKGLAAKAKATAAATVKVAPAPARPTPVTG